MIELVIFDLDDVLYSEREYMISGFREVSKRLSIIKNDQDKLVKTMIEIYEKDPAHVFDNLFSLVTTNIPKLEMFVQELLDIYRNHKPLITLYPDVIPILTNLKNNHIKTAIITDGHEITQRLKIESLELCTKIDHIIINDSLGPNRKFWKPNPLPFKMILEKFNVKSNNSCYVGDNAKKDFEGPNILEMRTIQIQRPNGIYSNDTPKNMLNRPEFIIKTLNELNYLKL